jgi:hypothetical protein
MDLNEVMQLIKENGYDVCPECGTRKGNEITLPSEKTDDDQGSVTCANPECGISWVLPEMTAE